MPVLIISILQLYKYKYTTIEPQILLSEYLKLSKIKDKKKICKFTRIFIYFI